MDPLYEPVRVRAADERDVEAIRAIRNDAIEHSTAVWSSQTVTAEECRDWAAEHLARGALLVAEVDGEVVGYASWARWRPKEGYRFSAEDSVYVLAGHQGNGVGRALLEALIAAAREGGCHVMVADIEAGNTASIGLHESLGFERVGTLREVGTKFGRWLDLTILQLRL